MKKLLKLFGCAALSALLAVSLTVSSSAEEAAFFDSEDALETGLSVSAAIDTVEEVTENTKLSGTENGETDAALPGLGSVSVSAADVYSDMRAYFEERGCTNTKINSKTGLYTDIGSFWDMLAMKALGIPGDTGTDYDKVDYQSLNAQVLAKFIIAMVNDGKDPAGYGVRNENGVLVQSVVELMKSYYNEETGAYGKPNAKGEIAGSVYHQPFVMYALAVLDEEVGEKAGSFFASAAAKQNDDGILAGFGIDMDTTSWAITACHLAGVVYPNEDKALAYMETHISDMNANTLGCYLDCLANIGKLTEAHIVSMVNDAKIYDPSAKSFLYNGKANVSATQQATVPLGEFYNKPVYQAYDEEYVAESGLSEKTVYVRIADARSEKDTTDILKRTKLSVASGASLVLDGVSTASADVTLLDVFTEAVCAEKLGRDPAAEELAENSEYINEKLGAANMGYGLSITKLYGYEDGSFGYYTDRENMAWSPLDTVTADGTEVFIFHYDYSAASYAVFDRTEYTATTASPASVTVKKMSYDRDWNPVFAGTPATVYAKNRSTEKIFVCAADGTVTLSGLPAGDYELTAYGGDAADYIVSPYAVLTVTKADDPEKDDPEKDEPEKDEPEKDDPEKDEPEKDDPEKDDPGKKDHGSNNSGSSSGGSVMVTAYLKPDNTGSAGNPVTNGSWTQLSDGRWLFRTNTFFRSTWGFIRNAYAPEGKQDAWFYFDRNGYMLTGWQHIIDSDGILRWYYFNPVNDGTLGACLLDGVTPDGYTVNASGAWTVDGVVQEKKATSEQIAASMIHYSTGEANETVSKGNVSVSLSANVTTSEGKKVSFSGSKKFSLAEYEGSTAFDLLAGLCSENGWDIEGSGSYVSAINGLAEFDAGSQSGWMYSVNGRYPEIPAGDYVLKKNDKVVWRYVTTWVNTGM